MMEKPSGRRHDAFTDWHQRVQMGDEVHGYEAEAVSAKHALRTIYPAPLGTAHDCRLESLLEKLISCLQSMIMACVLASAVFLPVADQQSKRSVLGSFTMHVQRLLCMSQYFNAAGA